jgi:hypothetical protein
MCPTPAQFTVADFMTLGVKRTGNSKSTDCVKEEDSPLLRLYGPDMGLSIAVLPFIAVLQENRFPSFRGQ